MPEPVRSSDDLSVVIAELRGVILDLRKVVDSQAGTIGELTATIEDLRRRLGRNSSNSGKPPSSDPVYDKQARSREGSSGQGGKRGPGKQPGADSATMSLVDDPDETVLCPPAECSGCGADLRDAPVTAQQRRQVTEAQTPPPPTVTEYLVQAKECGCCGVTSIGAAPEHASGRVQFGPDTHALAANLLVGHHVPVHRSTILLMQMAGVKASTGWMASVRGKAADLLRSGGFAEHLAGLLKAVPSLHADETPARADGKLSYVHVACTRYLTLMHVGGRSADDIDAGGVLPGYSGVIVRDGYAGYCHLTDALHAWCGAHLLRDLKDLYSFEPDAQAWAKEMAGLLCEANQAACDARQTGATALDEPILAGLLARYRALASEGFTGNYYRRTRTAQDAVRLSRRFRDYEDMILRFAANPGTVEFTNYADGAVMPMSVVLGGSAAGQGGALAA